MAVVTIWAATRRSLQRVLGWLVTLGAAVVGLVPFGGLLSMVWTMLVSWVLYAWPFGWSFAAGFVVLLLLHELGHVIALRSVGMSSGLPVFIPFVGAVVHLRAQPKNAKMEANIALGGPALGTLSALFCISIYLWTDGRLWLLLSYTACLLNLINLIPCSPLDGGKIARAFSRRMWLLGMIALAVVFYFTRNPFLLVLLLINVVLFVRRPPHAEPSDYHRLSRYQRVKVAVWYFALICVLSMATCLTFEMM